MKRKSSGDVVDKLVSAGGVVYNQEGEDIGIVLCGRREPATWSLPKGTPDKGETILETAVREAQEETGLRVAVEGSIGSINYWFVSPSNRTRYNKTVYFYLMSVKGGCTNDHDPEFDEVKWFNVDDALQRLTYENEAGILNQAFSFIRERTNKI